MVWFIFVFLTFSAGESGSSNCTISLSEALAGNWFANALSGSSVFVSTGTIFLLLVISESDEGFKNHHPANINEIIITLM